ncbi:MAG: glycosyltransferase [Chloroflexota bacterium]|nr:glycosyltransferase [Chloroflexota bacterium]
MLTLEQAEHCIQTCLRNQSPLVSVLGALNLVSPKEYARHLAEYQATAYVSELIGTEFFHYDRSFVRCFDPSVMLSGLFFPLEKQGDTVTVLTVDPTEQKVLAAIESVVPGADILPFIGTERDVTRLLDKEYQAEFLHNAVQQLREERPEVSASTVITIPQKIVFAAIVMTALIAFLVDFWATARVFVIVISLMYLIAILYKFALTVFSLFNNNHGVNKQVLTHVDDADLPLYSILVPVYKEPEVVPRLLKALAKLDYPSEKLDVLLLMEKDDVETIIQAKAARPPSFFRFILIPDSLPRTKPKACNYGLPFCRGEYVTIYDAEDIPEPDQLKKAVAAFRSGDPSLICVQARLNYFNSRENYLTAMFTLEYSYWFDLLLPGLDALKLPIPLGGTSNHFRMDKLRQLGAWDPFNVTEDADLGIRASVEGYTVGVIPSTTYEEANKKVKNWIRQRSRWIKGYMQTWLVHNRDPIKLFRTIGMKAWLSYNLFIGGTFAIFLINPIMWALFATWLLFQPGWMTQLFAGAVWYIAIFSLVVGNLMAMMMNTIAGLQRKQYRLALLSLTNPLYWMLHSVAAYVGLWQLITKPFYWEKTDHGLTNVDAETLFDKETKRV